MIAGVIISISALLQFAAAIVAMRLMAVTGRAISWGLISLAIFLMAIRRSISLLQLAQDKQMPPMELSFDLLGLFISFLMLIGLILISPLFSSMSQNILKLKKAEESAIKNEKRLNNVTSSLAEGIYVIDKNGSFSFMNKEAENLIGWTFDELKDRSVHDLIHHKSNCPPTPIKDCKMIGVMKTGKIYSSNDEYFTKKDGSDFPISVIASPIFENGEIVAVATAFRDITERKKLEKERESLINELEHSLKTIKTLQGVLPICSSCKKIRNDEGYWTKIENYIKDHSEVDFSHGICPECTQKLYPDYYDKVINSKKS
jgi:PAS domain S-box-containing protein